jgi:hypothetical protein
VFKEVFEAKDDEIIANVKTTYLAGTNLLNPLYALCFMLYIANAILYAIY